MIIFTNRTGTHAALSPLLKSCSRLRSLTLDITFTFNDIYDEIIQRIMFLLLSSCPEQIQHVKIILRLRLSDTTSNDRIGGLFNWVFIERHLRRYTRLSCIELAPTIFLNEPSHAVALKEQTALQESILAAFSSEFRTRIKFVDVLLE